MTLIPIRAKINANIIYVSITESITTGCIRRARLSADIGVWHGTTLALTVTYAIGIGLFLADIDPEAHRNDCNPNMRFAHMTSSQHWRRKDLEAFAQSLHGQRAAFCD